MSGHENFLLLYVDLNWEISEMALPEFYKTYDL